MLLSWSITISSPVPQYVTIFKRVWKKFNINGFQNELLKSTLCTADFANDDSCSSRDVDSMVNQFSTTITALLDKHTSVTEITVRESTHRPWFDDDSRTTRQDVRRLERRFKAARKHRLGTVQVLSDKWRTTLPVSRKKSHAKAAAYWRSRIAILVICGNQ